MISDVSNKEQSRLLLCQILFMVGTAVAMLITRKVHESLRFEEIRLRLVLSEEEKRRELAERSVLTLASQVAHDIRSPLSALNVFISQDDVRSREGADLASRAVLRIKEIAIDLLTSTRPNVESEDTDSDVPPNGPEAVLVWNVIHEVIEEKSFQFRGKVSVRLLSVAEERDRKLLCLSHRRDLHRIVSNLIDNSFDSISESGEILVSLHQIDHEYASIKVSDDGCGIDPGILPRLMNPGATFNKKNGSGIALHHAKRTVKSWGGDLVISSVLGEGTTVTLRLRSCS
jgi:signal transduction histidine kinase